MKMKLAQRILIGYYKTKLRTIGMVSPAKAAELAYKLFCTPYTGRSKRKEPPVFHKAEKLFFEMDGNTIRGYRWRPEHPNGKTILIVHGFSSYAYKFEKYINPLKKEGFEVLAFDAPAHGNSGGKYINAAIYKNALLEIEQRYGPVYGIMGHSLGGLAGALAFEQLTNNQHKKLVLVAPATETHRAIDNFFTIIPVDEKTRKAFEELIGRIAEQPISYYSVSRVVKSTKAPVLWVHDRQDSICTFEDVQPVIDQHLPHIRFIVTEQLGHSKVYKDSKICSAIVQFLADGIS